MTWHGGAVNGFLPDGTNELLELMLNSHYLGIYLRAISQRVHRLYNDFENYCHISQGPCLSSCYGLNSSRVYIDIKISVFLKKVHGKRKCYLVMMTSSNGNILTFSTLLAFSWGIYRSPVNSPHKSEWSAGLIFCYISVPEPSPTLWSHCNVLSIIRRKLLYCKNKNENSTFAVSTKLFETRIISINLTLMKNTYAYKTNSVIVNHQLFWSNVFPPVIWDWLAEELIYVTIHVICENGSKQCSDVTVIQAIIIEGCSLTLCAYNHHISTLIRETLKTTGDKSRNAFNVITWKHFLR